MIAEFFEWARGAAGPLLLPPVPWLVLVGVGAFLALRRKPLRKTAGGLLAVAVLGLWLSACQGMGEWLEARWVGGLAHIGPEQLAQIKVQSATLSTAVLVLGGGRLPVQAETRTPELGDQAMQRLRYGLWLSRQTGVPLAYSGGGGLSPVLEPVWTEAKIAETVLLRDHGVGLRWVEGQSRNTLENAKLSLPVLAQGGVKRVLVVTHAYHMRRAMRSFDGHAALHGLEVVAAPMGFTKRRNSALMAWLPSSDGARDVRQVWREALGWVLGR